MQLMPRIVGLGSYVPPRIVRNAELGPLLDTSDEWIQQRTGIETRHYVEKHVTTSDIGAKACQRALDSAGLRAEDIDLLVCATVTPDHEFPGTGCFLQAKLGVPAGVPAFDVRQQCSGFVFGLSLARQYLATGVAKRVLLVCAEIHSKCLDMTPRGRDVSVLFGDGAAAVVLSAAEKDESLPGPRVLDIKIGSDGTHARDLWCPGPGTGFDHEVRINSFMLDEGLQFPKMNGRAVFSNAVRTMAEQLVQATKRIGVSLHDVDLFVIHQANRRIAEAIADMLQVDSKKFHNTIYKFGNTTAASIPLGLADAVDTGALAPGMLVGIAAFGSGYTFGSAMVRW